MLRKHKPSLRDKHNAQVSEPAKVQTKRAGRKATGTVRKAKGAVRKVVDTITSTIKKTK